MADEPEEIEVDLTEKPQPEGGKDDTPVIIANEPDKPREIVTPEEGVDKLKQNLEAANRRAEEESRRRREAESKIADTTKQLQDGELREVSTALDMVGHRLASARSSYRAARESGDVDAEIAATEAIADARGQMQLLEAGKAQLTQRAKEPVRQQPTSVASDPAEALAVQIETNGTPRSAAWIRAHPEYARDPAKYHKMVRASEFVLADGATVDTDEYFQRVESMLGIGSMSQPATTSRKADLTPEQPMSSASRPSPPSAAPVSRQPAGSQRNGTVRLRQDQAEAAEVSFPDLPKAEAYRAYARNLQALRAEGKMN